MLVRTSLSERLPHCPLLRASCETGKGAPARLEIVVADPEFAAWAKSQELLGTVISFDAGDSFHMAGKIFSRQLAQDPESEGSTVSFVAYDLSAALLAQTSLRAFSNAAFSSIAAKLAEAQGMSAQISIEAIGRLSSSSGQFVQYGETDFDFLQRLSRLGGGDLWPYGNELWLGEGPGAEDSPFTVDVTDREKFGGALVIDENYFGSPTAYDFPRFGTAAADGPRLKSYNAESPVDVEGREGGILQRLARDRVDVMPPGLALEPAQRDQLAKAQAKRARINRTAGAIQIAGPPPKGLKPGCTIRVCAGSSQVLIDDAELSAIRVDFVGGLTTTTLQLGRRVLASLVPPSRRLATHLWPARAAGPYHSRLGTVLVAPMGWAAESEPMTARLLSAAANEKVAQVRCPKEGELGLIGFEFGDPDFPVWIGALHDDAAPDQVDPESTISAWRLPDGGSAILSFGGEGLQLTFKKTSLSVSGLSSLTVSADTKVVLSGESVEVNAEAGAKVKLDGSVAIESSGDVKIKGTNLSLAGSKIDMKQS